ncbi:hypothetical protein CFAM422_007879 [Trichoderma lentiforme]|uniref:Uncharacterized protein n=1 Tax=Trichoderma lentiforme TaxID=1567552 RepID=A0A9P4XD47_9HYPO|nr:hypothetical protein CFAM422_007879 [Trichoderma lentiforme]
MACTRMCTSLLNHDISAARERHDRGMATQAPGSIQSLRVQARLVTSWERNSSHKSSAAASCSDTMHTSYGTRSSSRERLSVQHASAKHNYFSIRAVFPSGECLRTGLGQGYGTGMYLVRSNADEYQSISFNISQCLEICMYKPKDHNPCPAPAKVHQKSSFQHFEPSRLVARVLEGTHKTNATNCDGSQGASTSPC